LVLIYPNCILFEGSIDSIPVERERGKPVKQLKPKTKKQKEKKNLSCTITY
jgi:hypothetical protein